MRKFEGYFKDIVKKKKRGLFASLIRSILLPLSYIYRYIIKCRNELYDRGLMRRYVPPIPLVISIGNIVVGGTGKTPITLLIAKSFYERYLIAILSRGYRSKAENLDNPVILCAGEGPIFPVSYCGDEPYLFAQRLPKALVIVGRDRKKSSLLAAKHGVQVVLLDDALQHRHLARDFDVIVVDAKDPFGHGYLLPRGFLREEVTALKRANLIVLNHVNDSLKIEEIKSKIRAHSAAPIVSTCEYVTAIRDLKGETVQFSDEKKVGMFCSIAQPDHFRYTLEQEGFTVIQEYCLPDHAEIHEKHLEQFAQACLKKGAHWLICTEKDRVKLHEFLVLSLPVIWVQIEIQIIDGKEEWNQFLSQAETFI